MMDYHCDSRAHDSGYFTPSPDKDNKIVITFFKYFYSIYKKPYLNNN